MVTTILPKKLAIFFTLVSKERVPIPEGIVYNGKNRILHE